MKRIGASLACCLLLVSCGPGASPMSPVASAVEEVPVPRSAERNDRLRFLAATGSGTEMAWLRADRQAGYVVPGISSEDLLAWYDEHLPIGQPWREWTWCERPSPLFQRIYHRPGTNRVLALMVPSGDSAGVLILQADSASCCAFPMSDPHVEWIEYRLKSETEFKDPPPVESDPK